ncbi:phytoene/squalene synthase family protein [Halodesulfurarchaeum sp. HSR-GB]|uniref:phytoene/squalene synthase family protein n=1 Tax=Halodesulfurarchaeum sp. HSR-GB TaxID=3074077 RepID=UPI0028672CBA|nr:phytoene/squalene synthase family protein [Halodesulfurarchaeum sp. HSR-GB]MDR5655861.1 phytoene/squalene synthase family protein [Halodesulfurarchaeum sp. HSR-GB]
MPSRSQLAKSKRIHRRTGRTFYLATRLFPQDVREATYVLYAFFRIADDIVDTTEDRSPDAQRERLEHIRAAVLGRAETDEPVLLATRELLVEYDIPESEVDSFIDAMIADIDHEPYATRDELDAYMRGSAVAVANMMLAVMDVEDEAAARPHAAALAEAFQLTNFLRDVREDIRDYDRVYLPGEVRSAYGVTIDQLEAGEADAGFRRAMQVELARTEARYRTGVAGIRHLPKGTQFPVLAAAVLYAEYHRVIASQEYDVLGERPSLSTWRKLSLVARTRLHWALSGDPVAVFDRVAAIGETDHVDRESLPPVEAPAQ